MFEANSLGQLVQLLLSHREEQKANIDTGWTVCVCHYGQHHWGNLM